MSEKSSYRSRYDDARIDEAYRLYVDGKASQRELEKLTGINRRTITRRAAKDGWTEERSARAAAVARAAVVAAVAPEMSPMSPENGGTLSSALANAVQSLDVATRIAGVATRHQRVGEKLWVQFEAALDAAIAKAAGKSLPLGQIFPLAAMYDKLTAAERRANGMADVTKVEIDDRASLAKKHAEAIERRRQERLAKQAEVTH